MATVVGSRPRLTGERRFYLAIATLILALVVIGFGPTYYYIPVTGGPSRVPFTPLIHLHGLIFSLWVLLFMAQVGLISARRTAIHRRMGAVGLALATAMIVLGTLTALHGAVRASGPPVVPPLSWLAVPLLGVPAFGGLILAALHFRRDPQTHKRLMVFAMLGMLAAATGRLPYGPPVAGMLAPLLLIPVVAWWDWKSRGRLHRATLWGSAVLAVSLIGPLLIWETGPWLAFAGWAAGLAA
ncbi:MAG: hypothetical protein H7X93_08650 [Sphingomonadaceae bacterium]|nr:hypothetical protein [Sphingomonadaceae bacterium]